MKNGVFWILTAGIIATSLFVAFAPPNSPQADIDRILGEPRSFVFHYRFAVEGVPAAAKSVEAWVPVPQSDEHQTISSIEVTDGLRYKVVDERTHGNQFVRVDLTERAIDRPMEVTVSYRVDRIPCRSLSTRQHPTRPSSAERTRYLQPNRLVPLEGAIVMEATRVAGAGSDPLGQARALYDNIVATVSYDKSGAGWGRGDALYACSARTGNCTDFHSLFIAEARSLGIPARFVMGFPVPDEGDAGTVGGYHCWAEFYVEEFGWVPIDASEAHRHPDKRQALFGGLDADRVAVTIGRDISIPGTDGELLNYVIYPYVEVDGERHDHVTTRFSYTAPGGPGS